MNSIYFETQFRTEVAVSDWPAAFAIITAYATTGQTWSDEQNQAADQASEAELRKRSTWVRRLTGYSPSTGHAEPGWAVEMDFDAACYIGQRYRQDAIYYVQGDALFVSHCDARRALLTVGEFRSRVHVTA
jgi:hypothetical protein